MPQSSRGRLGVLAAVCAPALVVGLLAGAVPASTAQSVSAQAPVARATTAADNPLAVVSKYVSPSAARQSATEYWTPERMADAVPADRAVPAAAAGARTSPAERAKSVVKPSTGSHPVAARSAARKKGHSKTIGKVFFTAGKTDMVCSGAAVNSKAKNMVFTAGHCVNGGKGKGWHKNWIFVPGYKKKNGGGFAPNGIYPAHTLGSLRGWIKRSSFDYDTAIALVKPGRGANKKLVRNVGGFGVQFGKAYKRKLRAVGYSQAGYTGYVQKSCAKRTFRARGMNALAMHCKVLTPGSSGGPWLKGKGARNGYVNGTNSNVNKYPKPTVVRTSYFGKGPRNLFRTYRKGRPNNG